MAKTIQKQMISKRDNFKKGMNAKNNVNKQQYKGGQARNIFQLIEKLSF